MNKDNLQAPNNQAETVQLQPATAARARRGLEIAAKGRITVLPDGYRVPSQSRSTAYHVILDPEVYCPCDDFDERQQPCKHIYAALAAHRQERDPEADIIEAPPKVRYHRDWPTYNAAQEHEGEHFERLLRSLCDTVPQPERQPGRPGRPALPLPDVVYALGLKTYSCLSARRVMSNLRRAECAGQMHCKPSRTSATRYLAKPTLTPLLRRLIEQSALPLRDIETIFAIDSTGFSGAANNRWFDYKHGYARKKSQWSKLHIMCGVRTNIVTAADCTPYESADVRFFDEFVRITDQNFQIEKVLADKAYPSHKNFHAVDDVGGIAYIPFQGRSVPRRKGAKADPLWEKLYNLFTFHREEFDRHYHQRSNVESTIGAIKAKFGGEKLLSKTGPAQVNEVLVRVLCHNITMVIRAMYQLGINPEFAPPWAPLPAP